MRLVRLVERALIRALPARHRESIWGDLLEDRVNLPEAGRRWWFTRQCVGIVLRYQAAPYREMAHRSMTLLTLAVGWLLLWVVPVAAEPYASASPFPDPIGNTMLVLWSTSWLTSAIAVGLFAGRIPWMGDSPARFHAVAALAVFAAFQPTNPIQSVIAPLMLIGFALLGNAARRAHQPPRITG